MCLAVLESAAGAGAHTLLANSRFLAIKPLGMTKLLGYGNSRVTNFAGCVLVLVTVWVMLPGSHFESPDFMGEAG